MSDENETQEPVFREPPPPGPGERLRAAREERNLSLVQVGQQLNLESRQVRAMEENDWGRLPEPIYVAGYLRNYARLLGLPEKEIVDAYPHRLREPFEPTGPVVPSESTPEPIVGKVLAGVGAVAVIVLLVLIVLWWMGRFDTEAEPPIAPDSAAEAPVQDNSAAPEPPVDTPEPPASGSRQPPATDSPAASVTAPADAVVGDPVIESEPLAAADTTEPEAGPAGPQAVSSTPAASPAAVAPSAQAEAPAGGLVLRFSADSWTEVVDATGQRLVYKLIRSGETLVLEGEPPFRVFLGYAPGVAVEFNGEAIDTADYTRNDVARFSLGGDFARAGSNE